MRDIEIKEGNFNCIFYIKRQNVASCRALKKAYCREDLNCPFYKEHDNYKEIPYKIVNDKVIRITEFEDMIRYKKK